MISISNNKIKFFLPEMEKPGLKKVEVNYLGLMSNHENDQAFLNWKKGFKGS